MVSTFSNTKFNLPSHAHIEYSKMLQSNLFFCSYIQCVKLRISKKTSGKQVINSINNFAFFVFVCMFPSPMYKCQNAARFDKDNRSRRVKRERSVVVPGCNLAEWAEIILQEHSEGDAAGQLRSKAQITAPPLTSLRGKTTKQNKKCRGRRVADGCCVCEQRAGPRSPSHVVRFTFRPREAPCQNESAR